MIRERAAVSLAFASRVAAAGELPIVPTMTMVCGRRHGLTHETARLAAAVERFRVAVELRRADPDAWMDWVLGKVRGTCAPLERVMENALDLVDSDFAGFGSVRLRGAAGLAILDEQAAWFHEDATRLAADDPPAIPSPMVGWAIPTSLVYPMEPAS